MLQLQTIFLMVSMFLQPKFGGQIIDIVSKDVKEPEQKAKALDAVKDTILYIVVIVVIG